MKQVLLPVKEDRNPFFKEIVNHAQNTTYSYGDLNSDVTKFDAVLIHWPEQLFDWKEPSIDQIVDLKKTIIYWKQNVKVVHVVHNTHPHHRDSSNFRKLYQLVHNQSDIIVHLGQYTKEQYKVKYPNATHVVIEHPLYSTTMQPISKEEARQKLGIHKSKFIVVVPGRIRTRDERKLVLKCFNALKVKNKLLVVPRMYPLKIKPFKGYYKLRKILPIDNLYSFFANKKYIKNYKFDYRFATEKKLSLLISASDVVLVPRLNNLNSGNIFLGLTFKKLIIGPNNGNSAEFLESHDLLSFEVKDPKNSMVEKLEEAYKKHKKFKISDKELEYLHPRHISLKWDQLFKDIS